MKYMGSKYPAIDNLSDVIEYVYTLAIPAHEEPQVYHVAPSLEMMIVFSFGTPFSAVTGPRPVMEEIAERVTIMGPIREMLNCLVSPGGDLLVCCFINDGFYRLASSTTKSGDLLEQLNQIWLDLSKASNDVERLSIFNAYLLSTITESEPEAKPLVNGVPDIHNTIVNPVEVIATKAAVSERTIQLRFKKYTGYSSKSLLRHLRFKQLIAWLVVNHASDINWMDMVLKFGYHDQSHMIKDFKHYTGLSRSKILNLCREGNLCLSRDYLENKGIVH